MRLKRWESPRRQGRNDKGKGGSARQRQIKKQFKMLSKKLKDGESRETRERLIPLFFNGSLNRRCLFQFEYFSLNFTQRSLDPQFLYPPIIQTLYIGRKLVSHIEKVINIH